MTIQLPSAADRVHHSDAVDTCNALHDRIAELEALIDSDALSGDELRQARALVSNLQASLRAMNPGGLPVDRDLGEALDAMGRADAFLGDDISSAGDAENAAYVEHMWGGTARTGSGSGGSGAATTGSLADIITDGAALRRMFEENPDGFAAGWRELSAEDRQAALFALQQEVALDNQITQVVTSTLKSAHDTAMAVARNLQV